MNKLKKILGSVILSTFAISLVGCNMVEKTPEAIKKEVVAEIGSKKITKGELDSTPQMQQYLKGFEEKYGKDYEKNPEVKQQLKGIRSQVIYSEITRDLFNKDLVKKYKVDSKKVGQDAEKEFNDMKKQFIDTVKEENKKK